MAKAVKGTNTAIAPVARQISKGSMAAMNPFFNALIKCTSDQISATMKKAATTISNSGSKNGVRYSTSVQRKTLTNSTTPDAHSATVNALLRVVCFASD